MIRYIIYVFLWVPFILLIFGGVATENQEENRSLESFPKAPESIDGVGDYFKGITKFVDDQFPYRSSFIKIINTARVAIGVDPHPRLNLGKDGWIFSNWDHSLDQHKGTKVASDSLMDANFRSFNRDRLMFEERNIPFIMTIVPDKLSIYREYFNDNIKVNEHENYNIIRRRLIENNFNFVDMKKAIRKAKRKAELPLYYKTDSHWTRTGAYYGYLSILQRVKKRHFPRIQILKEKELVEMNYKKLFDINKRLNVLSPTPEDITDLKPKKYNITETVNVREAREIRYQIWHHKTANKGPKVLLIHDSFNDNLVPFYSHSFSEIMAIHHNWGNWDRKILDQFKPDIVIYETVERYLWRGFKS